ncbi:MAG TPA: recombinase family protein [Rhizomicrobium sp.]|jgi:hypothetical protein|nr:recombinase family protein [Rhizomicrobium sp.]
MANPASVSIPACIIHCRVSTTKQAYEGESLEVQEQLCIDISRARGWALAHAPWKESFSGRKTERPVFEEILSYLDGHPGGVQYYLFRSIDRFTRGGSLSYEQMKGALRARGVEMVDSYGLIQPVKNTLEDLGFSYEWSRSSPSEIAEVVVATSAKNDLTNILTRIIGQQIRLTQRGYKFRAPNDGFINVRTTVDGRKRTIQKPDPERAKYYIAMFELRAAGQLSDKAICERINAMGYRTKGINRWDKTHTKVLRQTGGKPLTPKLLQQAIKRPMYCGFLCETWTHRKPVKGVFDGLVSVDAFNAANRGKVFLCQSDSGAWELLHDFHPERIISKRNKYNPLFPYRHVVLCPHCRKPLLGSSSRGNGGAHYPAYHCARKHPYFGIPKARFEATFENFIDQLRLRRDALDAVRAALPNRYRARQAEILSSAAQVGVTVAELELHKAESVRAFKFAGSDAMRKGLEDEVAAYEEQIREACAVRTHLEISEEDIARYLNDAETIIEHPRVLLRDPANPLEQKALYDLVFAQLPSYDEIVNRTPKFTVLFSLFSDSMDVESSLVRLSGFEWNTIEQAILHWKGIQMHVRVLLDGIGESP